MYMYMCIYIYIYMHTVGLRGINGSRNPGACLPGREIICI